MAGGQAGPSPKARPLGQGKTIMEAMTKLSPDNAGWKRDLAWFEGQIAAVTPRRRPRG